MKNVYVRRLFCVHILCRYSYISFSIVLSVTLGISHNEKGTMIVYCLILNCQIFNLNVILISLNKH